MKRWLEWVWGENEGGNGPLIQIFAGNTLYMEGCQRILHCDEERICLLGAQTVTVYGSGLRLKELGNNNVCAQGKIRQIAFEG